MIPRGSPSKKQRWDLALHPLTTSSRGSSIEPHPQPCYFQCNFLSVSQPPWASHLLASGHMRASLVMLSLTVFVMKTGHSSSLLPSTTTSDSAAREGYESRGGMLDWKDLLDSPDSTDSLGAVSSHNHQDKKGKALELPLPLGGEGGKSREDCVTASSWITATFKTPPTHYNWNISKKTAIQSSVVGLILNYCPTREKPHKTNNPAFPFPPHTRGVAWPKADAGSWDPFSPLLSSFHDF